MKPNQRNFIVGALLLLGIGCAGYDDSAEQSEFEKLRKYPSPPQGDRILPAFDSEPVLEDSLRFAFTSEGVIPRLLVDRKAQKSPPQTIPQVEPTFSLENVVSKLVVLE